MVVGLEAKLPPDDRQCYGRAQALKAVGLAASEPSPSAGGH